ncbi:MAG: EipB family protein [Reyranellales bacterium]
MLTSRIFPFVAVVASAALPAAAQDLQPHRAVYSVVVLENGKPTGSAPGTYAYELRATCDGYIVNQRLRLEFEEGRTAIVSEQLSQMTESRDGKKLHFEHRSLANGKQTSLVKGEASLGDDGRGQSRFSEPEGQTVALPAGTLFPAAISRSTLQHARAGDGGFDALFFFGEKVKPPQAVHVVIGKVPKRLADLAIPDGGEPLIKGHAQIYYRGAFFDSGAKGQGEQAAFEMSSLSLDNGIELYGTHEESEGGIEYRITRLESLPRPNCN